MATAAFLEASRQNFRKFVILIKVELTDPSTRTLYLGSRLISTPGTPPQIWEEAIAAEPVTIATPGGFATSNFGLCTMRFTLLNRPLAYQSGSARLLHAFADYRWQGATVTAWRWETSLTDFADAHQEFKGLVQTYDPAHGKVVVHCIQRTDFNREIPAEIVGTDKWVRAPEKSKGRVLPICYGRLTAVPMRVPPWTAEYGNIATGHNGLQLIAGGRRAIPGVVVDIGRGGDSGNATKVVFAGHPVKRIGDDTKGTAIWMEQDGRLCRMQPGVQVNNCRCSSGVAAVTRPLGSFLTDGVHAGALLANAIAASFPVNTRITTVAAGSCGTTNVASATVSVDTVGEFLDLFNDSTDGAGLLIGDQPSAGTDPFVTMFVPVLPSNVELVASNNAENPRAVLDPFNDTSYSVLDYTNGNRELRARFPSLPQAGDLSHADIEAGVELISGSLANVKIAVEVDRASGNYAEITLPTPSPNPGYVGMAFATGPSWGTGGLPANPWQFGEAIARIYFSAAAAGTVVRVYAMGLALRVRPTREIVAERATLVPTIVPRTEEQSSALAWLTGDKYYRYTTTEMLPGAVPVYGPPLGAFAANMEGWADDGSGTITGTADAVIQRAPDVVRHLLIKYGGLVAGDFELGASTFGSLVKLRDDLKTWRQTDMEHAFAILERTPILRVIESIAADSFSWYRLSRFDNKIRAIAWRPGKAVDYARKIPRDWIGESGITIDPPPSTEIPSAVRVPYSFDHFGKNMLQEITIGPGRSSSGHRWRGIRDQLMTVYASGVGQNNKLDFNATSGNWTATLDAGDYLPMALAQHVQQKMELIDTVGTNWMVCYGPEVVTGYNDTIAYNDGSNKTATIAPGAYATFEGLAVAIAAALNAGSSNWSCTYSRASRKLTIARSSGTAQLLWVSGLYANKRALVLLGAPYTNQTGASSYVMNYEREEQRFVIGNLGSATIDLLWETGANGLNAGLKNCAALVGYDSARDMKGGQLQHYSHSPKGNRETACQAALARHGGKQEWKVPGTTIQDTDTAREIATRTIDLLTVLRPPVRFSSSFMPDLDVGHVIEFDDDADDVQVYAVPGTDGSVVGKHFIVVETLASLGSESFNMNIVAVEI